MLAIHHARCGENKQIFFNFFFLLIFVSKKKYNIFECAENTFNKFHFNSFKAHVNTIIRIITEKSEIKLYLHSLKMIKNIYE